MQIRSLALLFYFTFQVHRAVGQEAVPALFHEQDTVISSTEKFVFSSLLNACGESFLWDLRADFIWQQAEAFENKGMDTTKTIYFKPFISADFIRTNYAAIPLFEAVQDSISKNECSCEAGYCFLRGSYKASFCAYGNLILPEKNYEEVSKLKIEEVRIFRDRASLKDIECHSTSNYFFNKNQSKPILIFTEQENTLSSAEQMYLYSLCRFVQP